MTEMQISAVAQMSNVVSEMMSVVFYFEDLQIEMSLLTWSMVTNRPTLTPMVIVPRAKMTPRATFSRRDRRLRSKINGNGNATSKIVLVNLVCTRALASQG